MPRELRAAGAAAKLPDDYPEDGQTATIVGVFDTYMEGQNMYCNLRDATVV